MIYYDIIHSVFSLKSPFWKQVQKKTSLIFPNFRLSQALVNQEIDQVRQELLEEGLKKRRAREVEDNLVKQVGGATEQMRMDRNSKEGYGKIVVFVCLFASCLQETNVSNMYPYTLRYLDSGR